MLEFNFEYDTGQAFLTSEVANFQSDAAQAGIVLNISSAPFQTVVATLFGCIDHRAGRWAPGTPKATRAATPRPTPSTIETETNFSSPRVEHAAQQCRDLGQRLERYPRLRHLHHQEPPVIWTLTTYGLNVVSKELSGVQFSAGGYENTVDWYFSK